MKNIIVMVVLFGHTTFSFAAEKTVILNQKTSAAIMKALKAGNLEVGSAMGGRHIIDATIECREQYERDQECTVIQQSTGE